MSTDCVEKSPARHSSVSRRWIVTGSLLDFEATGLYAVCIQHELDHLIGKVFLDRMTDMSTLTQLEEFEKFWQKQPASVI